VVSEKQRQRVLGYLDRGEKEPGKVLLHAGATSVSGHEAGYTAYLLNFKDEDEAVALVNRSAYGPSLASASPASSKTCGNR
jgi:acyl-CoA reductase-like NAD-dependent aldehyde dehydrogenase